jgi:hypothetical protein
VFSRARDYSEFLPSTVTFLVNPGDVHSPQTGHHWYVEMNHDMGNISLYSLIPQKTDNQYVAHYRVESRRPRFIGDFNYTDAWVTTHHKILQKNDAEIHFSQTLFSPDRANDKIYFSRPPKNRIEVIVPNRFIEDREIWEILDGVVPREYQIGSLLQRQS